MQMRVAIATAVLVMSTMSCKNGSAPSSSGDVVGVSGSPVATTAATATGPGAPTTNPPLDPNATGASAAGDPFAQARNANPTAAAGAMSDPFAAARLVPIQPLPTSLPHDPGGRTPLKLESITFAFAGPLTRFNTSAELKPNGLLLLDSKRAGSVNGSKVTITSGKHPVSMSLRSDGYAVYGGYAALKKTFMHHGTDGMTSPDGNRLSVSPDGLAIVNTGTSGELLFARLSPAITDERGKTTALMIMGAMMGHGTEVQEDGIAADVSKAGPSLPARSF